MFSPTSTASRRKLARLAVAGTLTVVPLAAVTAPATADAVSPGAAVVDVRHGHGHDHGYDHRDRCDRYDHRGGYHDRWNDHRNDCRPGHDRGHHHYWWSPWFPHGFGSF